MPDNMPMSFRMYAKRIGVTPMAVSRAVKKGRLAASIVVTESGAKKIGNLELADKEWVENVDLTDAPASVVAHHAQLSAKVAGEPAPVVVESPSDENFSTAGAREKHWKAKIAELKFREEAGELVEVNKVNAHVAALITSAKTKLLGLPSRARQALPHLTVEDISVIDTLVREALEDLSA